MPRDTSFETAEAMYGYVDEFLDCYIEGTVMVFHLEDLEDIGSLRLVYTSHRNAPVLGNKLLEYLGKSLRQSWPSVLDTPAADTYAEVLRTQKSQVLPPFTWGDENFAERVYQISCFPLGPRMLGLWVADITHLEQLEADRLISAERMRLQALELERSNQELESFAYVASHDLKAPLRNIESLATWITEDVGDSLPAKSAKHLQLLRDRITRMQALLDDLLEYSRVGRVSRPSETIDLAELLDDVCALVTPPPGIEIVVPADADAIPSVCTPRAPLEQILLNLIANAIKHRDAQSSRVEVGWCDAGAYIEFKVSDDGPGIGKDYQDRIFRLFTTLRPRDQVEGSGMGLAIVKKLVEAHGGTVAVESEGRGATFRFTWPKQWLRDALSSKDE